MKPKDEKKTFNAVETLCYTQTWQAAEKDTERSHNNTLSIILKMAGHAEDSVSPNLWTKPWEVN